MRIRKRQVPLPLSSLSPVPLSDLHLDQSPPSVQLRPPPPSDQPLPLIRRRSGAAHLEKEEEDDEARSWSKGDTNKISYSKNPISSSTPVSSSNNQVEQSWCDGDKACPLKKRRGRRIIDHHHVGLDDDDDDEEEYDVDIVMKKKKQQKKKTRLGKLGGVVMEGSRCSRVNGRGWRCCQQTLVGYSLCEHHLGKGRLRGVSATLNKNKKNKKKNIIIDHSSDHDRSSNNNNITVMSLENETKRLEPVSCFLLDQFDGVEDEDDEGVVKDEKRVKLGVVKARSMSSLLGQPQQKINISYAVSRDHVQI